MLSQSSKIMFMQAHMRAHARARTHMYQYLATEMTLQLHVYALYQIFNT